MSLADRRYSSGADNRNDPARTHEHDRGRLASSRTEIPPRGWKDVLIRVYNNIGEDRVFLVGAGVTFYCLLAIFPAVAAIVALYGLFADPTDKRGRSILLRECCPG
jgi:membrane protein